ncbi:hypothetical protein HPB50_014627 [Hyalomma asiaticum]|uniref:Uncharacterized protein n=1 Tax=Hyalomma asiaticum TaxID=266040 RepID=A0ACB7RTQ8_HYAAI|nr:hypothetical protein HPB50_014627 [Hyalomma asiaticum]
MSGKEQQRPPGYKTSPEEGQVVWLEDANLWAQVWRLPPVLTPAIEMTAVRGMLQLGIDILRVQRRSVPDVANVVVSPYAAASALEELLVGSQGITAAQIFTVLCIPREQRVRFI